MNPSQFSAVLSLKVIFFCKIDKMQIKEDKEKHISNYVKLKNVHQRDANSIERRANELKKNSKNLAYMFKDAVSINHNKKVRKTPLIMP